MLQYVDHVEDEGGEAGVSIVTVNLRLSVLKPLHARWLNAAIDNLSLAADILKDGFSKAGL